MYFTFVEGIIFLPRKDALNVGGTMPIKYSSVTSGKLMVMEKYEGIIHNNCNILFNKVKKFSMLLNTKMAILKLLQKGQVWKLCHSIIIQVAF